MRRFLLLPLCLSMLVACSVDNDELMQEDEFAALNVQAEGCTANAGEDNLAVYTNSEIDARVDDFGTVRYLYMQLLDEGVETDGYFNPPLLQVFRAYNRDNFGDFTTTYVVGEGECTDSADLTITICEEIFDAGSDNYVNMTYSEIAAQIDNEYARINTVVYSDLLDEGVDRNGTFEYTGHEIALLYQQNGPGEYTNTYTLGEGNCGDTAELTINITGE